MWMDSVVKVQQKYNNQPFPFQSKPPGFVIFDNIIVIFDYLVNTLLLSLITFFLKLSFDCVIIHFERGY
ncbi:hypothetical protein B5E84_13020 [Lachnoclostridium sp. An14]|nr:hypothetical protein B5E84_13020 [Lachnoclostridium sp. An14]